MNFDGLVVLITGGARGIGQAIAERFHAGGARLALVDVNGPAAQALAAQLSAQGAKCAGYECNVTDTAQVDATVEAVLKDFGQVDVLINNAGITQDGLLVRMTDEAWDKVLDINLSGTFRMLRACARPMMKARRGAIVNIASVVALIGNAGQANYCSSKAGVLGLNSFQKALQNFRPASEETYGSSRVLCGLEQVECQVWAVDTRGVAGSLAAQYPD